MTDNNAGQVTAPPTRDSLADKDGKATLGWLSFFDALYNGDLGTAWSPTFVDLTVSGTPNISGAYYKIGQSLCVFRITIIPATSTSAVSGTTYIDNLPVFASSDGFCIAVSGGTGGVGHVTSGTNRIYVPAWSGVTVPLTIIGLVEI